MSRELEAAIGEFVDFYNQRRYRKALKDITPAGMLAGRKGPDPGTEKGDERQDDRSTETIEPRPQGAARNNLISLLPIPSHFAEVQHLAPRV